MPHSLRFCLALVLAQPLVWPAPAPQVAPDVYHQRRSRLRKSLSDGVTVLFGRTDKDSDDLRTAFFQEPNFYYLTGCLEPGAILLLAPQGEKSNLPREVLFLPRRDPEREKWTGANPGPDDKHIRRDTGFDTVLPAETLESELRKYLDFYPRLYALADRPTSAKLEAIAPLREVADASAAIARLRMEKSPEEIALIRHATDLTVAAHRAAWKEAAPGLYEYQVAAAMTAVYFDGGCERSAYAPIVGSGPNSVILHYSRNSRQMKRGPV
ncbi:MAG: aminopeptidase P N-terminal domain-containing protein, partial [Acidobacteria bacterium]|nr:aminopeptidase P N-terminal domain-containing protein [Acidobacteriota bacterium]